MFFIEVTFDCKNDQEMHTCANFLERVAGLPTNGGRCFGWDRKKQGRVLFAIKTESHASRAAAELRQVCGATVGDFKIVYPIPGDEEDGDNEPNGDDICEQVIREFKTKYKLKGKTAGKWSVWQRQTASKIAVTRMTKAGISDCSQLTSQATYFASDYD